MSENQYLLEKLFDAIGQEQSQNETAIINEYENFMRLLVKHCQCLFCGDLLKEALDKCKK